MPRKRTHEEFITEMAIVNPNIEILGTYINSDTRILCRCKIDNHEWSPRPADLLRGHGCPKCDKTHKMTHEEFVEKLRIKNPKILVKGIYVNSSTKILVKCLIDGHEWSPTPNDLLDGCGCPCCSNHVVVKGINDLATTHPYLLKYFVNKEEATSVTYGSHKKVIIKCPNCENEFPVVIKDLVSSLFSCSFCSDGVSYPNKFCRAFLKQLPISNLIPEYSPKWISPKKYDNYFEYNGKHYIVEMDGKLHTTDVYGVTAEESKMIDDYKDEQAKLHNINVIRIESEVSEPNYIKERIINSQLGILFDLSNIDWNQCDFFASSSLILETCKIYMALDTNGILNKDIRNTISEKLGIAPITVRRYLKCGARIGLCDYDPKKSLNVFNKERSFQIIVSDLNNIEIGRFKSARECSREISKLSNEHYSDTGIGSACKRDNHIYKNYIFKYAS